MENYLYRTWKNKIAAIALILTGLAPCLLDHDATALIFIGIIALPLFLVVKIGLFEFLEE